VADSLLGQTGHLLDDCIVAVSTPRGRGAVGIVRLSGAADRVGAVLQRVLTHGVPADLAARTLALVSVRDADGAALDRGLLAWFRAPGSYTGEDVAELHLHGNPVVLELAVQACVAAGARLAGPGEFTRRAVAHGKLSLSAAEGVDALIRAPSARAARAARLHLDGELDERLRGWIGRLLSSAVALEALVDFPDEVEESELVRAVSQLEGLHAELSALLATARAGRRLLDGVRVALTGPVNAGKSTLLNALVGHDRAIVSPIPGTTRDVVSETVLWGGLSVRLEDTAGYRDTQDPIEAAGIARSTRAGQLADVVLAVRDGRDLLGSEASSVAGVTPSSDEVRVATHGDLIDPAGRAALADRGWLVVDGVQGEGMAAVRAAVVEATDVAETGGQLLLHTARQIEGMRAASEALAEVIGVGMAEPVLAAVAVRRAGRALEELAGGWSDERVLDELFARFCIGK
jgi:tRNA modification GTPase